MKRSISSIAKNNSSALLSPLKPTLVFTAPPSSSSLKSIIHNLKSTSLYGFTIIELLVVIAVIGILAAITLVSYSGVSTRATIATMQSDLSNASTALRLDHATTDSFPASLALANNGRGIAPSQSMDDIIYVPDNTSNPKNFCLQYRKGTNTYAVDATTQPSKGVCLKNLITGGDFNGGTTGWLPSGGVDSIISGKLRHVSGGQYTYSQTYYNFSFINDHTYAVYFDYNCDATVTALYPRWMFNNGTAATIFDNLTRTTVLTKRGLVVALNSSTYTSVGFNILQYAPSGAGFSLDNVVVIDLTASFGAGNEPNQAQMDIIMSSYANSWINITAKANL